MLYPPSRRPRCEGLLRNYPLQEETVLLKIEIDSEGSSVRVRDSIRIVESESYVEG